MSPDAVTRHPQGAKIDWAEAHRRLERAQETIESLGDPTPLESSRVLRDRARALALPLKDGTSEGHASEYLEFELAGETYAVQAEQVSEVLPLHFLTALPGTPAHVEGIISHRGRIVCVIHIGKLFALPERGLTEQDRVVLLSRAEMEVGVLANVVRGIVSISDAAIGHPLPAVAGVGTELVRGVTSGRVVVLDAERILRSETLVVRTES
ncbi:MAG TPA: chemotaxis protein CheW [Spirochaetia bacterium]|nr:chemotaxis protein CheW [Spirochaetia bacterium]